MEGIDGPFSSSASFRNRRDDEGQYGYMYPMFSADGPSDTSPTATRKRKEDGTVPTTGGGGSGGLAKRKRSASAAISLQHSKKQLQTPWSDGHNFEMHEDFRFFTHGPEQEEEDTPVVREQVPQFTPFSTPELRKFNPLIDESSTVSLTDFNDFFGRSTARLPAPKPHFAAAPNDMDEHKFADDEFPRQTNPAVGRTREWMDDAADNGLEKLELDIQHLARITEDSLPSGNQLQFATNIWP